MVHTCRICSLSSNDNKDLSFHRFPKNLEKRQKWASALGVQQIGDWHYVCGNHFNRDSYIFSNTRNILKSNAIPFIVQNSDDESCSPIICSSASDNYSHVNTVNSTSSILNNVVVQNSDDESCSPSICSSASDNYSHVNTVNSTPNNLNNVVVQNSDDESCSPSICSSASDNYSHVNTVNSTPNNLNNVYRTPKRRKIELNCDVTTPKICPKKKLIWSSNRFGDLSASDFGTPNCAARNFEVVKRTVTQLRKKNKYLNQKCKRLEKKVVTLNDMLDILKKKSLMTDFAADSLKVHQLKQ
ncbi:uncharacterized protein LOC111026371 isoform X1 [Myzus persicae]|uniref:uncharacterized protein LOC111026371 isoform X1 n=1 Tax=Myzus persicae TaxID=13164 RepID=UPI000B933028|nr:uncharacterized protein LOC111026371 isoform X1 [Myzus persicae]